jgi:transcriptional regulator with XRE-family HTH domain
MPQKIDKNPNRFLWQARQRSGLPQKAVAFLLNRKATDKISRYESGQKKPSLSTALKLEIIYRVPVRLLFHELYSHYVWEIRERSSRYKELFPEGKFTLTSLEQRLEEDDYCAYADLLKTPNLPQLEKQKVYDHIRKLATAINKLEGIS